MPGLFALSVDPAFGNERFLEDLFWGTFYHQHLGEAYAGLSTCKAGAFQIRTHRGRFRATFTADMEGLAGTEGIGYCGPVREPYFTESRLGKLSTCFSGNVTNLSDLLNRFKGHGHVLTRGDDIELLTMLVAQGADIADGIRKAFHEAAGAISLVILTEDGVYAARGPEGHWPLLIGEKEGAVAVASESGGFANLGYRRVRDVRPGEVVRLRNGRWESLCRHSSSRTQSCSFYWVYTGFPNSVFEDVPDSGRFHAIGYQQEFCRQMMEGKVTRVPLYDELLLKYPYAGRSFIPREQKQRDKEARIKLLASGEDCAGKVIVVCDDSIVRGTQTQMDLVPKLRGAGVKEIHLRISNPELRSHCRWGKTTQKGELLADRVPVVADRARYLGVEDLEYNTIQDLAAAIGRPVESLCVDCDLSQ